MLGLRRWAFALLEAVVALALCLLAVLMVLGIFLQSHLALAQLNRSCDAQWVADRAAQTATWPPRSGPIPPVVVHGLSYSAEIAVLQSDPNFARFTVTVRWPGRERVFRYSCKP